MIHVHAWAHFARVVVILPLQPACVLRKIFV